MRMVSNSLTSVLMGVVSNSLTSVLMSVVSNSLTSVLMSVVSNSLTSVLMSVVSNSLTSVLMSVVSNSLTSVCPPVRGDNLRALERGLSPRTGGQTEVNFYSVTALPLSLTGSPDTLRWRVWYDRHSQVPYYTFYTDI